MTDDKTERDSAEEGTPGPADTADPRAETSGVDRLLSRFGPVPSVDPARRPPGPKPNGDGLLRPRPGPRPAPETGDSAPREAPIGTVLDDRPQPEPLFAEPHDEVFGEGAGPLTVDWGLSPDPANQSVFDTDVEEPYEIIDRRDWVRMPRRTGPVFRFLVVAFVLGIGASFVFGRVTTWFDDQVDPPGEPGGPVEFSIQAGATANDVTQNLFASDVIANPTLFRYWLSDNFDGEFQAGDYACVRENMSFDETLACLDGEGPLPPQFFSITIPEGLRLPEILAVLNRENPNYARADLDRDLQATLVSVGLNGVPDGPLPNSPDITGSGKEGLLFPATYQIDEKKERDTLDILRRMADTMETKFEDATAEEGRAEVIGELGLTDYEVLIVASLIEEEARTQADRPKISRVIYNRLVNEWSLGIDATSCYAAQKPCADLTQEDLDSSSPWNTRDPLNRRLPPTPIAAPGEASIRAALAPEEGPWMYYVLTEADGSHTFAVTDEEFQAAKRLCAERGFC